MYSIFTLFKILDAFMFVVRPLNILGDQAILFLRTDRFAGQLGGQLAAVERQQIQHIVVA